MKMTGWGGYYSRGKIIRNEIGEEMNIEFGYLDKGAVRSPDGVVFGVESVPVVRKIEVMADKNIFRRNMVVRLEDGDYLVLSSNDGRFSTINKTVIITIEVQKN